MSEEPVQNGSVFISYSRKDKDFVQNLYDGLVANHVKAWVDWEGIPLSADWMDEITRAIDGADAFLVIISPDWLASKVCAQELELGLQKNKKLVPILYRVPEKGTQMPEKLAATNWVYMRAEDDFAATLPKLVEAINTDLDWVRQHTRLIQRATEWDKKSRNPSFLLHGTDLEEGEGWMNQAAMNANRQVLPLQADYVVISRKEALRRQRMVTIAISLAMVVSLVLAVLAVFQGIRANRNAILAKENEAAAVANEKVAKENEQLAKENELKARQNEQLAKENEQLAKENEIQARAQRNAAVAQLYQDKAGSLDTSTLVAIDSWNIFPSFQAEDIIRKNLSYMPVPVAQNAQVRDGAADNQVTNIEFSPDGSTFATNGFGGLACAWDAQNGAQRFCIEQGNSVADALFTLDGKLLVTAGDDGFVRFWDASDGKPVDQIELGGPVIDLDRSPDGKWLAIARLDKTFTVINLSDPKAKRFNIAQDSQVNVVKISPDSKWLAAGTDGGQVSLLLLGSNFPIKGPTHNGRPVLAIAFRSDSAQFVSVGGDSQARVAKTESGRQLFALSHGDWVEDVSFNPDGNWFITAADDNRVWMWNVLTGVPKSRLHHESFVLKVRFSPDGRWIASTGADRTLRIWDTASGSQMLEASLDNIGSGLAFTPDGKRVIVGDRGGNVTIWDVSFVASRVGYIEFSDYIYDVALAPNGEWFVTNTADFNIWQFNSNDLLKTNSDAGGEVIFKSVDLTYRMAISPDSSWVAVGENNKSRAILYNVKNKTTTLLAHGSLVTDVAFTPDSQMAATAGKDNQVVLWDVNTGNRIGELKNPAPVLSIDMSPDGKYLIAGLEGRDDTTIWDLAGKTIVAKLPQAGNVSQIAFSPDGKWLATGDDLGMTEFWDTANFKDAKPVHSLKQNGDVTSLVFSPDSRLLVTGGSDGYVYLWDLSTGDELARLPHTDAVTGMAFSADSKLLLTVSRKVIQIWQLADVPVITAQDLVSIACDRLVANLGQTVWESIYYQEPYRPICPNLPKGND